MLRPVAILLALLLSAPIAWSQVTQCQRIDLKVRVHYSNSRPARSQTRIDLLTGTGMFITQTFTDDNGNAEFNELPPGNYRVRVAQDFMVEETTSDVVTLYCRDISQIVMITAKLRAEAEELDKQLRAREAIVSALELNVPKAAKKEFERGVKAMQKDKLDEAQLRFESAIREYPQYAMAYNHLGVVYMMKQQPDMGEAAFARAVDLNDRYPSALLNLAKVRMGQRKADEAANLLKRALSVDPVNVEILAVLSNAQLVTGQAAEAVETARRVHAQPEHHPFAVTHFIAGKALEAQNKLVEALAEYEVFVKEAPMNQFAQAARQEIARLKAQVPAQR